MRTKNHWSGIENLRVRGKRKTCYARVELNGKEHWRSLHIQADPEGRNLAIVKDALRAFKAQLAQNSFAILQLTRTRNETSTFSELFTAYRAAAAGRPNIQSATVERNIAWLSYVLRVANGEFFHVEEARTSILGGVAGADLVEHFQAKEIETMKTKGTEENWSPEDLKLRLERRQNSLRSIIGQARAVFSAANLQSRHYRDLILPDLTQFMKRKVSGSFARPFKPLTQEIWAEIKKGVESFKTTAPSRWYAIQLSLNCGLRRASARNARWSWCTELANGDAEVDVKFAKEDSYRIVIPAELWQEWLQRRDSVDYIIPGATDEERDEAIDQVVAWLRELGVQEDRPFHYLRKYHGDAVDREHGIEAAARRLGHKKSSTTKAHYVEGRSTIAVARVV